MPDEEVNENCVLNDDIEDDIIIENGIDDDVYLANPFNIDYEYDEIDVDLHEKEDQ